MHAVGLDYGTAGLLLESKRKEILDAKQGSMPPAFGPTLGHETLCLNAAYSVYGYWLGQSNNVNR